jgi:hypothetical protein
VSRGRPVRSEGDADPPDEAPNAQTMKATMPAPSSRSCSHRLPVNSRPKGKQYRLFIFACGQVRHGSTRSRQKAFRVATRKAIIAFDSHFPCWVIFAHRTRHRNREMILSLTRVLPASCTATCSGWISRQDYHGEDCPPEGGGPGAPSRSRGVRRLAKYPAHPGNRHSAWARSRRSARTPFGNLASCDEMRRVI